MPWAYVFPNNRIFKSYSQSSSTALNCIEFYFVLEVSHFIACIIRAYMYCISAETELMRKLNKENTIEFDHITQTLKNPILIYFESFAIFRK